MKIIRQLFEPPSEDKPSIARVALGLWVLAVIIGWLVLGKDLGYPVVTILAILSGAHGWQQIAERKKG